MKKLNNLKNNNVGAGPVSARQENKGITLIALIITIIVMLILVTVSIQVALNTGLFDTAGKATQNQRAVIVIDKCNVWRSEKTISQYTNSQRPMTLVEFVDDLQNTGDLTAEEAQQVKEKGYVIIGDKTVIFVDGIEDVEYTVTSSNDEISFIKTIKEGNIKFMKEDYESYTIEGISAEKEGTYITTGSINGKSGTLSIVGDIADTTFNYELTNFMKGDETFYVKVNIDDEIYYQELQVIQGEAVRYEEDFVGFTYNKNGSETTEFIIDYNENYSGGSGMIVKGMGDKSGDPTIEGEFYGSKVDLVCAILSEKYAITSFDIYDVYGELVYYKPTIWDWPGYESYNCVVGNDIGKRDNYLMSLWAGNTTRERHFYFDAIVIYK